MQTFLYNPYRVELRTNPNSRSIVYAVMDHSDTNEVWQLLKGSGTALVSIYRCGLESRIVSLESAISFSKWRGF